MSLIYTPPIIRFGEGALAETGQEARRQNAGRAFLITSTNMPGRPALSTLQASRAADGIACETYAAIPAEPSRADLQTALDAALAAGADLIIGLGGGSAIDIAKLVAMLLINEGPVDRYFGTGKVPLRGIPTIMVPTTAGSGSEVSQDAVLTDRQAGTKFAVKDPKLVPTCAIVDPLATVTCPSDLTAVCGMDALTHALEAFTAKKANPITDMYATRAISLLLQHLVTAVEKGFDLSARLGMALGSLCAGMAFSSTGTAAVHACGYPLSGIYGIPHGAANALMLPHVVAFNAERVPKYQELHPLFGTTDLFDALCELTRRVGLPVRLRDAGVEQAAIARMAAIAITDERHLSANPRPVLEADLVMLFKQAW